MESYEKVHSKCGGENKVIGTFLSVLEWWEWMNEDNQSALVHATTSSLGGGRGVFASFLGVSTPTIADGKLQMTSLNAKLGRNTQ